jgi:prepilin-type N-terminal cleavage/methylation domain-containing protein
VQLADLGGGLMTMQGRFGRRWRHFWQLRSRRGDSGLTLAELVVVLLIVSIVMSLASLLIINVNRQSADMLDTVSGIDSQTGADLQLVQYLQASTRLLGVYNNSGQEIGPSATELDMIVNDGFNTTSTSLSNWGQTQTYQSNCTNIDATWVIPSGGGPNADAQFVVSSDVPSTGPPYTQTPWSNLTTADGAGPYTFSPASPCSPATALRGISSYFALSSQTDPVFTYWAWSTTASSTTSTTVATPNIPPGLVQLPLVSGVLPACAIPEVAAVGVHVTFLAGPQTPKEGYAADQPTTLNTLVFLIGSSTSGATTTTTPAVTTTTVACSE